MNEDRATRYHRLKRRALVLSLVWSAVLLTALLVTGASLQLREAAMRAAAGIGVTSPALVVLVYVAGLTLIHEAGSFAIAFYGGFAVERRYGLSNERFTGWLWDQAKSLGTNEKMCASYARSSQRILLRSTPSK